MNDKGTGYLDICGNELCYNDIVVYIFNESQMYVVKKSSNNKPYILGKKTGCRFNFENITTEEVIEKP